MIKPLVTTAKQSRPFTSPRMITALGAKSDVVTTARGSVTYLDWLKGEQQRLAQHGVQSEIFKTTVGKVCLLRKD